MDVSWLPQNVRWSSLYLSRCHQAKEQSSALLEILARIWGTLYGPQSLSLLLLS